MKKILVICDDVWHPAEIVEQGFSYIQSEKIQFDFVRTAKDILTEELLAEYLSDPEALLNFLFNDRLVVKLYEG